MTDAATIAAISTATAPKARPDALAIIRHYLPTIVAEENSRCCDLSYLIHDLRELIADADAAVRADVAAATAAVFPVRFNQHAVTNGTQKARVHYSLDNRCDGRRCVTIYAKDHGNDLEVILGDAYENGTDTATDYFDKGRAVLFEDHPHYAAARARVESILALRAAKARA